MTLYLILFGYIVIMPCGPEKDIGDVTSLILFYNYAKISKDKWRNISQYLLKFKFTLKGTY